MTKKRQAGLARRSWQIEIPILSEPLVVKGAVKIFALAFLLVWLLVSALLAVTGDYEAILPLGLLFAGICLALLIVGLVAAAILYRNGIRYRFTLDDEGVLVETVDRTVRRVNWLLIVLGALTGKPGAVGTGLIAESMSTQRIAWRSVVSVRDHPRSHAIALANVWRTTAIVYCPEKDYESLRAFILAAHAACRPAKPRANPIPRLLLHTGLTIAATVPLFKLPIEIELFLPFLTLCFALASIWLIPILAWVVIFGVATIAAMVGVAAFEVRPAMFGGGPYLRYELLSGDDIALMCLALLGAAYLLWLSRALLTGRLVPALLGDLMEMGDT